ncbi:MAG: hypothetical protein DI573_01195 [Microbacterium sp.]|uniref:hypothetical protein n=1 Tax=Microbacterium sp. TaxID=51671 RepID=UPI000DB21673|nr:hypothetical protein [Microbacterium sp.]PZU41487.1 MAG: hypothetical protein DI573_01195 [Microbacterium sp.]
MGRHTGRGAAGAGSRRHRHSATSTRRHPTGASFKGNFFGKVVGDPWIMPGLFVLDRTRGVRYRHEFRHQGDHPVWSKLVSMISPPTEPTCPAMALV